METDLSTRTFDPNELPTPKLHGLLLSAIAPRPIAFASTISGQGESNLAPFSFFNVFSAAPPTVIFSPARRVRNNTTKHTLQNVEETMEVVINVVSADILHQMNLASCEYPDGVNEFEKSGLTPIASESVKPFRVKESPVQLECVVKQIIHLGEDGGAGNLIVAEVVRIHAHANIFNENEQMDPQKLKLVARMGQNWYSKAFDDAIFEVPKPNTNLGMGVDAIPEPIRQSSILTGNDLGLLGMCTEIPPCTADDPFFAQQDVAEVLQKEGKDGMDAAHGLAHRFLETDRVKDAWKLLMNAHSLTS